MFEYIQLLEEMQTYAAYQVPKTAIERKKGINFLIGFFSRFLIPT